MKFGKKEFLNFSLLFAVFFIILTVFVQFNFFTKFDLDATVRIQNSIPQSMDTLFSAFSLIGSAEIAGLFLLLIVYLYKKMSIIIVLLLFAVLHIPELLAKTYIDHPGPPIEFLRSNLDFFFPSSGVSPGFAYPSGHAARTIFVSVILFFLISRLKLGKNTKYLIYIVVFTFDFLMLSSRVYLGEHWTSDVIGGSFLGAAFAFLSLAFL